MTWSRSVVFSGYSSFRTNITEILLKVALNTITLILTHKLFRGPYQVWFQLAQWFQRRRLKCIILLTTTDARWWWQYLTWPLFGSSELNWVNFLDEIWSFLCLFALIIVRLCHFFQQQKMNNWPHVWLYKLTYNLFYHLLVSYTFLEL